MMLDDDGVKIIEAISPRLNSGKDSGHVSGRHTIDQLGVLRHAKSVDVGRSVFGVVEGPHDRLAGVAFHRHRVRKTRLRVYEERHAEIGVGPGWGLKMKFVFIPVSAVFLHLPALLIFQNHAGESCFEFRVTAKQSLKDLQELLAFA